MGKGRKKRVVIRGASIAGDCSVPSCHGWGRALGLAQKALFQNYGPVCPACLPLALHWLASAPSRTGMEMWCEFIEERETVLQNRQFAPPRARPLG